MQYILIRRNGQVNLTRQFVNYSIIENYSAIILLWLYIIEILLQKKFFIKILKKLCHFL